MFSRIAEAGKPRAERAMEYGQHVWRSCKGLNNFSGWTSYRSVRGSTSFRMTFCIISWVSSILDNMARIVASPNCSVRTGTPSALPLGHHLFADHVRGLYLLMDI
jgi:hypothetical protein